MLILQGGPWTPACAGATNRARMPCPKRRHHSPPAMAKPSRQWPSPSAAPSAARGRRELSRRCLSPPGRVSTRPAGRGWSEGTGASRRCGRGRFFASFLCRHKKGGRPPGRDPANHRQPKARHNKHAKGQRPWTPACAGATNRGRLPSPNWRHGTTTSRQWRSRAGSGFPLLQRRVQPAAGGNCRVDV